MRELTPFQVSFLRLVKETIELGVEPDRALKLWGMVVERHVRREDAQHGQPGAG